MERIDLILHPVRFRILQALAGETLTTQELAELLPDAPKSSIYRHLRLLLDGGMVAVSGTRPVRGVFEKTYRLDQPIHISADEISTLTAEEHMRYFQNYAMTLIQGFSEYVAGAIPDKSIDMADDRAGYTEAFFYATSEELDQFAAALNGALVPLMINPPGEGRRKHKLAIITHPAAGGDAA